MIFFIVISGGKAIMDRCYKGLNEEIVKILINRDNIRPCKRLEKMLRCHQNRNATPKLIFKLH